MNYVTIKLWEETRRLLRLLAADSGEQMVEIMHRLCVEEIAKRKMNVAMNVAEPKKSEEIPQQNAK
jgi:hypothetical protein